MVATSYDASAVQRMAWVRGLGVDERMTVMEATPGSSLQPRDMCLVKWPVIWRGIFRVLSPCLNFVPASYGRESLAGARR